MTAKVGRNDPCTCGSGKKFKKCHGSPARTNSSAPHPHPFTFRRVAPAEVPGEIRKALAEQQRIPPLHTSQFGHVRPLMGGEFQGHQLLVMGNKILTRPKDKGKFPLDFLDPIMGLKFTEEWWNQELAKPPSERHPMFVARSAAMQHLQRHPVGDGSFAAPPTGPLVSYFAFAYDMFVVDDNGRLDDRLIERLKNASQFQGARHELFAEATCLRAGFTIEHEDETDGNTRHAEFTAVHRATGIKLSVEAKSKHRPGVLGQPGVRQVAGQHTLRFGHLLNDAIAKNPPHPLVVFLDMNLPEGMGARLIQQRPPHKYVLQTLDRLRVGQAKLDPISLLVITNHPNHYTNDEETPAHPQLVSIISERPLHLGVDHNVLLAIHKAANLYGNLPQTLPGI